MAGSNGRFSLFALALVAVLAATVGCMRYGRTTDEGYKYATALYSVCNLEDSERLSRLRTMVEADRESESISAKEARWIEGVMEDAESGDWETAKRKSRKLMEDQLGRE